MQETSQILTIEGQSRITLSCIEGVISFSESKILLVHTGGRIEIGGKALKIEGFSKANGGFSATGTIESVRYLGKGEKLKSKIFR